MAAVWWNMIADADFRLSYKTQHHNGADWSKALSLKNQLPSHSKALM